MVRDTEAQESQLWYPMVEFRFRVNEYLKGSGPNGIGGLVYRTEHDGWFWDTREQAQAGAANMIAAHDSRWDQREAIVFLWSDDWRVGDLVELGSGQYWFGEMTYHDSRGINEAYSVASIHQKAWLPEAPQPAGGAARSVDEKLFLLDAPATTTAAGGAKSRNAATPTISLGALKNKINTLEAEANAGGTPEYRECVETSYKAENSFRNRVALRGLMPQWRWENTIASGLPAGTFVYEHSQITGGLPDRVGRAWFEGPDKDLFQWVSVDFKTWPSRPDTMEFTWRVLTARPLPAGAYVAYPNILWYGGVVCNRIPELSRRYRVIDLTVTPPARTLHEAFFDPVAIGAAVGADGTNRVLFDPVPIGTAVGADGTNGVLKPTDFALSGTTTTMQSLKWQSGVVTMELNPSVSLAGYAIDFIARDGSVALTLSFDDATQSGGTLTWSVPNQPWEAGDLLMLRMRASADS